MYQQEETFAYDFRLPIIETFSPRMTNHVQREEENKGQGQDSVQVVGGTHAIFWPSTTPRLPLQSCPWPSPKGCTGAPKLTARMLLSCLGLCSSRQHSIHPEQLAFGRDHHCFSSADHTSHLRNISWLLTLARALEKQWEQGDTALQCYL